MTDMDATWRRRVEELEEDVERLRQEVEYWKGLAMSEIKSPPTNLSPQQREIWQILTRYGRASNDLLVSAIDRAAPYRKAVANIRTLQVQICWMRGKGVPIRSIFGWGYEMERPI